MKPFRPFAALLLLLCADQVWAQPHPFGCHYFRNLQQTPVVPSGDREEIAATIARSDTFDILHYDIALDLSTYSVNAFKARTSITFTPRMADRNSIRFDLMGLQVDSVFEGEVQTTFEHVDDLLRVDLLSAPAPGEERTVTVHYHGAPDRDANWGGFYYESSYMYNLGIGLSTIPPNFGKVWYPCFDSFAERATYTYHVKSTGAYRFHGQGELINEVALGGDTVVRSFQLDQRIPTHISAVAVAAYVDSDYVHTGAYGDIPVRLTAKAAHLPGMVARFGDLGSAIDVCEHWYGPYTYDRVGYVLTTDGALEIPTNVAYPEFMASQGIILNRALFAHELGHHWWGDNVTPYVHNDMWLKEGPAEYSGHLIEEWIGGRELFINAVRSNHYNVLRNAHLDDGGYQALSPMPDEHIYGTHTYYKGASVMHNLRGYMGDEAFREGLTTIQQDLADTTMTVEDLKNALEASSGTDLDPFFDAWVFAPGYAVFELRDWEAVPNGDGYTIEAVIGQKLLAAPDLHEEVPLDISFLDLDGNEHTAEVIVGGATTSVAVDVPFLPDMVSLNRPMRLNQARMAEEVVLAPDDPFTNLLPFVDFRVYETELVDTTLVRIEHIWCAPDQEPLASGILEISGTHYWNVDGLWPEGTVMRGRLYYQADESTDFDVDLVDGNEYGMALLYRRDPTEEWDLCPEQVLSAGNLTNGTGYITFENMQKGQYAFGKISGSVGVDDGKDDVFTLEIGPVPALDHLTVRGGFDGATMLDWDMISADGRFIRRQSLPVSGNYRHDLDISGLAAGPYVLRVSDARSDLRIERRFEVLH